MTRHSIILDHPLLLEAGGCIENASIVYYTSRESYTPGEKVIVICHALTANANPQEWWEEMVGPGRFFDTDRYFILCVSMLGSPYGECGPVSVNPSSGRPYYFDFPLVTIRDMISAGIEVRKALHIDKIDLLVGSSIGGFQAFEWTLTEPEMIENVVFIATSPRISPWLLAGVETQLMALESDMEFRNCETPEGGKRGLKCARAQAIISYRCFAGYEQTQSEAECDTLFADKAASYQRYQGEKLAARFDAYSYYYLCKALTSHNVGRNRGGVECALSSMKARSFVIMIDSDNLFPMEEGRVWSKYIPGVKTFTIESQFGHDGFLLEYGQLTDIFSQII